MDAAKRLFAEFGYHAVSVTEIAREAGVSHGLIHAHFEAKAGLLYAILAEGNALQTQDAWEAIAAPGSVLERIERLIRVWVRYDLRDPALLSVMEAYYWQWSEETEAHNRASLAEGLAPLDRVLTEAQAAGELRQDLDRERAIRAIFALYTQALRPAVYDDAPADACAAEALAQVEMLLAGSRVEPGLG
jgi:AcrR family transcriptional regulator